MLCASTKRPATVRRVEGSRLSYYREKADIAYWNRYWLKALNPGTYTRAKRGYIAAGARDFARHLPKAGRILEAGCGAGHVLLALRVRGFEVEGVEWAAETVARVRQLHPDLPIRVGDVTRLDVPDGYYAGYISLGVMEHRREGPEPFLAEAYRVLRPGGVAMVSVPWFHRLRQRNSRRLLKPELDVKGLEFHQYAYTRDEFTALLQRAGFEVVDFCPHAAYRGLRDDMPLVSCLIRLPGVSRLMGRVCTPCLERVGFLRRRVGHMLMLVARKPADA